VRAVMGDHGRPGVMHRTPAGPVGTVRGQLAACPLASCPGDACPGPGEGTATMGRQLAS